MESGRCGREGDNECHRRAILQGNMTRMMKRKRTRKMRRADGEHT
jgi:hypothetical protein